MKMPSLGEACTMTIQYAHSGVWMFLSGDVCACLLPHTHCGLGALQSTHRLFSFVFCISSSCSCISLQVPYATSPQARAYLAPRLRIHLPHFTHCGVLLESARYVQIASVYTYAIGRKVKVGGMQRRGGPNWRWIFVSEGQHQRQLPRRCGPCALRLRLKPQN